jgi:hypothetical protein
MSIFKGKFLLITGILILLWCINSFIIYGGTFTLSLILKKVLTESNREIIISQIKIYLYTTPGCLIGAILSEIKFFGRKVTILLAFIFITIFNVLGIIDKDNIASYFGLCGLFIGISFNATGCYSCEVYPTKIRDVALGFLYFSTRLAGFLSQFISIALYQFSTLGQFYAAVVVSAIAALSAYLLPYDTYGRPLDDEDDSIIKEPERSLKE